ncbi:tetratricopeptide repeat protein [Caballeronia calidae]|uniref:Tetratricopeptide repeat protein n=1 Tax=Caballeronia calidae TaxID=1777139 RepID=A0A158ELA0_9BURK|nr:tetratricopeptide repeat-containing glycosyltransferase family protein [Caballeronia calidae]SAL07136.1 tetratricopeptide repeat protein [Caballeronia calidae]
MNPNDAGGWNRLGLIALRQHAFCRAQRYLRRAIGCAPGMLEAHVNLGLVLTYQGQFDEAVQILQSMAGAYPRHPALPTNIGLAYMLGGRPQQALPYLRQAVALAPDDARLSFNLACALLALGQWEEGWQWYETRLKMPALVSEPRAMPMWRGESLENKRLLLSAEQGFGDTLQFMRYVPVLAKRGAQIYLSVPPPLVRLARTLEGVHEVITPACSALALDLHCPLPSVPQRLGVRVEEVAGRNHRYLRPEQTDIDTWGARLNTRAGKKLRVGLVWHGSARGDSHDVDLILTDKRRSLSLAQFAPLATVAGVMFVSLQKRTSSDAPEAGAEMFGANWFDPMEEMKDFSDTAAVIDHLDLVISVDTAVAHLAGALNRPVWLLSRLDGCWRWLLEREDSVWYGSMRVFRQQKYGDWTALIERIAAMLKAWVRESSLRTRTKS